MSTKEEYRPSTLPYPTADQINERFAKVQDAKELGNVRESFAKDCHGVIKGYNHSFSGEHHDPAGWFEHLESILSALHEETFKLGIVRVIGGGDSPFACIEAIATAKTKTGESLVLFAPCAVLWSIVRDRWLILNLELGKEYHNEFVWIVRFNTKGEISEVRAYYDSAHLEQLAKDVNKAQQ